MNIICEIMRNMICHTIDNVFRYLDLYDTEYDEIPASEIVNSELIPMTSACLK